MRKVMTLLSVILLSMTYYCGSATAGDYKDQINWEKVGPTRSIFPISGYVEEGIVTIYLYESPAEATVRIVDESGCTVYENGYVDPETLVIGMDGQAAGSYRITVEYDGKVFYGTFNI